MEYRNVMGNIRTKNTGIRSMLFAAPLVTLLSVAEPSYAKPTQAKAKIGMLAETKEALVERAFAKIVRILAISEEANKKAFEEIKQGVIAVVTGAEVTVEPEQACGGGVCLSPRKLVDMETGEVVKEEEEKGRMSTYNFSLGNAKKAQTVAQVLKTELRPLKKIVVSAEGDTITVENTEQIVAVIDGF